MEQNRIEIQDPGEVTTSRFPVATINQYLSLIIQLPHFHNSVWPYISLPLFSSHCFLGLAHFSSCSLIVHTVKFTVFCSQWVWPLLNATFFPGFEMCDE